MAFGQSPASAGAGAALSPAVTVQVEDSLGNVVASDSSSVTIAIGNNPSGGTLSGTRTVAAVNGVATFSNLSINMIGNGYTLVASDTTGIGPLTATSPPLNVYNQVATSVTVTPATIGLSTGAKQQFTATALDQYGAALGSQPTFTWSATTGSITTGGLFTSAGTAATVTATSGSLSGTAQVTVANTTVASISLSPGALTLPTGGQQQFTATALDQFGDTISPPPALTWTATGGSISPGGLFNAPATAGTVTVTAASGSVNASVSLTLAAPSSWWKFDEAAGTTANDSSGNGHTATVSGASWTTGIYGDALQFNGTKQQRDVKRGFLERQRQFHRRRLGENDFHRGRSHHRAGRRQQRAISTLHDGHGHGQFLGGKVHGSSSYQFNLTSTQKINDGLWHYVTACEAA